MGARKTLDQKQADLHDTHRILREFYSYSQQGVPSGCIASKIPMTGVPTYHRKQADYLLKELKSRQVVKIRLSEECLSKWRDVVKAHPTASLFWFRDNLPRLLSGMQTAQGKPQTKLQRLLNSPVLTTLGGAQFNNNRQDYHFIEGEEPDTLKCLLTGNVFHTDAFK